MVFYTMLKMVLLWHVNCKQSKIYCFYLLKAQKSTLFLSLAFLYSLFASSSDRAMGFSVKTCLPEDKSTHFTKQPMAYLFSTGCYKHWANWSSKLPNVNSKILANFSAVPALKNFPTITAMSFKEMRKP